MSCKTVGISKPLTQTDQIASPQAKGPESLLIKKVAGKTSEVEVDEKGF